MRNSICDRRQNISPGSILLTIKLVRNLITYFEEKDDNGISFSSSNLILWGRSTIDLIIIITMYSKKLLAVYRRFLSKCWTEKEESVQKVQNKL